MLNVWLRFKNVRCKIDASKTWCLCRAWWYLRGETVDVHIIIGVGDKKKELIAQSRPLVRPAQVTVQVLC